MTNKLTKQLIYTAFFAAIIFIGTTYFRINIAPKVMIHLGNALVVITFLALGTKFSMLAASVGLGIFDILNGYLDSIHFTILESIIVIAVLNILFKQMKYKDTLINIFILSLVAGLTKIVIIFIRKSITNYLIIGNATALFTTVISMANTFITSSITIFIVPILYFAIKKYIPNLLTLDVFKRC